MDNRYYENVISEMKPFLLENGFKESENGFANDKKAFTVSYDDEKQMYKLFVADIDEEKGTADDFREVNAWLFDDTQNAKDAAAVGIDFTASLRKELGIKTVRKINANNVELPTAVKGDNAAIGGFAKKMLDVFPTLKEEYKAHITIYGNFLYLNFFGEYLVPQLKNVFETGTKKQVKKVYDVFDDFYVRGDRDTVNTVVALLCAASYNNEKADTSIKEMLSDNSHFLASYNNFKPVFAKNKKILAALVK